MVEDQRLMTDDERAEITSVWNGLTVFVAVLYLEGGWAKAALVALFFCISCLLGYGRRWLFRGGLVICLIAVSVALGFPRPAHWADLAKSVPYAFSSVSPALFSQASTDERR